jgi:hypothetical protein
MQKKIMLALILSSNGIMCQEPAPVAAAQEQPASVSSEVAPAQPAEAAGSNPPGVVPQGQQEPPTPPAAIELATVVSQTQTDSAKAAETPEKPASEPTQQSKPAEEAQPASLPEQPEQVEITPKPQEPEEDEIEIKGIDTVDINEAKGNWLYKRIWWEKAERTYEKIKQLTDKILESRMSFFVKRNDLDRAIVEFYSDLGFKQGELTELVAFMTNQLDQERKAEGSLNEKERELLELLTQEKKNIEQLQQGSQNISKIDRAIEDALMKLVEQLNQAKYYEQQAWEYFKAINRELSDKKARELFYSMDTFWRNLNSINSYLSGAYAQYFDQLTQKLQQETDKIKTNVQALSEKGISLQSQALAMKKECKMPAKEEAQPEEPAPTTGLLGTLWGWVTAPFSAVGNIIGGFFSFVSGLFGGSASEDLVLAKPSRGAAKAISESSEEPS